MTFTVIGQRNNSFTEAVFSLPCLFKLIYIGDEEVNASWDDASAAFKMHLWYGLISSPSLKSPLLFDVIASRQTDALPLSIHPLYSV